MPPQSLQLENECRKTISLSLAEVNFLSFMSYLPPITAGQLKAACIVSDSSVYKILQRMIGKGLLAGERQRRETPRTPHVRYRITPFGQKMFRAVCGAFAELDEEDYVHRLKDATSRPRSSSRAKINGRARTAAGS